MRRRGSGRHAPRNSLLGRELLGGPVLARPFLADLSCDAAGGGGSTLCSHAFDMEPSPPYAVAYSQRISNSRMLAVADEDGYVSCLNTDQLVPSTLDPALAEPGVKAQWLAHDNAIFDLCWTDSDRRLITASGDKTVAMFDTITSAQVASFRGHRGSVKTCRPWDACPGVLASGARDGCVQVWDARQMAGRGSAVDGPRQLQPVLTIKDAHRVKPEEGVKRRRASTDLEPLHGVTAVLFLNDGVTLATAGATDGCVKLWDMRQAARPRDAVAYGPGSPTLQHPALGGKEPRAQAETTALTGGARRCGITCLQQPSRGSRLLVSVNDGAHYLLDGCAPNAPQLAAFRGHASRNFFVKAVFSPDDSHLLSGSADCAAYIWQVDRPEMAPYVLKGHGGEVTGVAWCPSDFGQVATCGDDATLRVWKVHRPWPPRERPPTAQRAAPEAVAPQTPHLRTPAQAAARRAQLASPPTAPHTAPHAAAPVGAAAAAGTAQPAATAADGAKLTATAPAATPAATPRVQRQITAFFGREQQQQQHQRSAKRRWFSDTASDGGLALQGQRPAAPAGPATATAATVAAAEEAPAPEGVSAPEAQQLQPAAAAAAATTAGATGDPMAAETPAAEVVQLVAAVTPAGVAPSAAAAPPSEAAPSEAASDPIEDATEASDPIEDASLPGARLLPAPAAGAAGNSSDDGGSGGSGDGKNVAATDAPCSGDHGGDGGAAATEVVQPTPVALDCHEDSFGDSGLLQPLQYPNGWLDTRGSCAPPPSAAARAFNALQAAAQASAAAAARSASAAVPPAAAQPSQPQPDIGSQQGRSTQHRLSNGESVGECDPAQRWRPGVVAASASAAVSRQQPQQGAQPQQPQCQQQAQPQPQVPMPAPLHAFGSQPNPPQRQPIGAEPGCPAVAAAGPACEGDEDQATGAAEAATPPPEHRATSRSAAAQAAHDPAAAEASLDDRQSFGDQENEAPAPSSLQGRSMAPKRRPQERTFDGASLSMASASCSHSESQGAD